FFVLTHNNKEENIMKRKALAILIKEIIKRNLALIIVFFPAILVFVITFVIGMLNGIDILETLLMSLVIALVCDFAFLFIFFIVVTVIQLKKEYDNILDNLNNCHDENK